MKNLSLWSLALNVYTLPADSLISRVHHSLLAVKFYAKLDKNKVFNFCRKYGLWHMVTIVLRRGRHQCNYFEPMVKWQPVSKGKFRPNSTKTIFSFFVGSIDWDITIELSWCQCVGAEKIISGSGSGSGSNFSVNSGSGSISGSRSKSNFFKITK